MNPRHTKPAGESRGESMKAFTREEAFCPLCHIGQSELGSDVVDAALSGYILALCDLVMLGGDIGRIVRAVCPLHQRMAHAPLAKALELAQRQHPPRA
jgi:hypothetical protein